MADGPMPTEGVDYAWSRPDITALAAAGKRFACRYGGPGSTGKQLDPVEAQALSAAGVAIVANAEGAADGLLGGWSVGASWARSAEAHFAACGMPPGRPIYFSVDFDTTSGNWAALDAAMDGAASVIGRGRVGVYGEYSIIEHFAANRKAVWYWQTYAWSSGRWSSHNHIEQYRNGVSLAGATLDLDRALTADFGQWTTTTTTIGETKVHVLVRKLGDPTGKVFICDGIVRRWVEGGEQGLENVRWLAKTGQTAPLYNGGEVLDVEDMAAYGVEVGVAAPVELTDEQVARLVAAVPSEAELEAAAQRAVRAVLGSLDNPVPPAS